MLAGVAAAGVGAGLSGCLGSDSGDGTDNGNGTGNGTSGGFEAYEVLDRTVVPSSDGNPVVETLDANPGEVLEVDTTYTEGAVATVVHGDTGAVLARSGLGVVHDQETTLESEPLPESTAPNALVLSMHENDQVDVTVTAIEEDAPSGVSGDVAGEIATVGETIQPGMADRRATELVGPAWLWLFETVLTELSGGSPSGASEELDRTVENVYGALARQEVDTWVTDSVATVAETLGTAAAGAVQAKTGLPAFLVEGALQDQIETALQSDLVSWRYDAPEPGPLDVTGGEVTVVTTLTADLTIENVGFVLDAPLELFVGIDGDNIPASATVEEYEVLVEGIEVETS